MTDDTHTSLQAITLREIDGEPRARDLDIGERLGFDRPRDLRKLIERHREEIEAFGVCATVARTSGASGGRPSVEFWLNEEQALLVSVLSEAPRAAEVRAELIRVFVAWRRGELAPKTAPMRDVRVAFKTFMEIGKLIGLEGNEAILAANRGTVKVTGFNAFEAMGTIHLLAERQEELLTATQIGQRLDGVSAQFVNKKLEALGFQETGSDGRGGKTWHPTEKGKPFGKWLDTSKKHQSGTSVMQWKWYETIIPELASAPIVSLVGDAAEATA